MDDNSPQPIKRPRGRPRGTGKLKKRRGRGISLDAPERHLSNSHENHHEPDSANRTGLHIGVQPTDLRLKEVQGPTSTSYQANERPEEAGLSGMMSDTSTVLQASFIKHMDITRAYEVLSETSKAQCLEGICNVVQKLHDTKFSDLKSDMIAEWYSAVRNAENAKMDVKWLRDHIDKLVDAMKSKHQLRKLEEAERKIRLQGGYLLEGLEKRRAEAAKLEHEIKVLEEEHASGKLMFEKLKAQTEGIEATYRSFPKYLMDGLL